MGRMRDCQDHQSLAFLQDALFQTSRKYVHYLLCFLLLMPLGSRQMMVIPPISVRGKLRPRVVKRLPHKIKAQPRLTFSLKFLALCMSPLQKALETDPLQLGCIGLFTHDYLPAQVPLITAAFSANNSHFFPKVYAPGKQVPSGGLLRCYANGHQGEEGQKKSSTFSEEERERRDLTHHPKP